MSVKENKELARRYITVDANQIKAVIAKKDEFHAPEFIVHASSGDMKLKEFVKFADTWGDAFPDFTRTVEDIIAEGDKVVARCKVSGTHKGTYMGIAPTGKKFIVEAIWILRIGNGKIVEAWYASDMLDMMQQIGAITAAPPKK